MFKKGSLRAFWGPSWNVSKQKDCFTIGESFCKYLKDNTSICWIILIYDIYHIYYIYIRIQIYIGSKRHLRLLHRSSNKGKAASQSSWDPEASTECNGDSVIRENTKFNETSFACSLLLLGMLLTLKLCCFMPLLQPLILSCSFRLFCTVPVFCNVIEATPKFKNSSATS